MKNRNYYSNYSNLYPSELGDFSFGVYKKLVQQDSNIFLKPSNRFDAFLKGYNLHSLTNFKNKRNKKH